MTLLKELFIERTRVVLTLLAIAWGTFTISGMLAVGEGLRINFSHVVTDSGVGVLYIMGGQTSKNSHGNSKNNVVKLKQRDFDSIRYNLKNWRSLIAKYTFETRVHQENHDTHTLISAVPPDFEKVHPIFVKPGGRFLNHFDSQKKSSVAVIGTNIAKRLFKQKKALGETIYIDEKPFMVIGVMPRRPRFFNMDGRPDAWTIYIPQSTYLELADPQVIQQIILMPQSHSNIEAIKKQIRQWIALNHGYDPDDQTIIEFQDTQRIQDKTNGFFIALELFLGLVGTMTLLVSGIGIGNVMYTCVKRSTRDIGICMAVGAKRYQILRHFLLQSVLTTWLGGSLGFIAIAVLCQFLSVLPIHNRLFNLMGSPRPQLSLSVTLIVIVILSLIGMAAGFFPAWKAATINPVEALRHE